jgi:hypothetical protein
VKFHDSSLIRILADLCLVEAAESKPVFAERLAQWLDLSDAITLHAAHNASAASSSAVQSGVPSVAGIAVEEEYARVKTALVDSITKSCSPNMGEARIRLPTPKPGMGIEVTAYEPYRRFYVAHQGAMEAARSPIAHQCSTSAFAGFDGA